MKKRPPGRAGAACGTKTSITGTNLFDLHNVYGDPQHHIELTDYLADQVRLLQAFYGRVAFLTPAACASCGHQLPPGARDAFGMGVMNNEPVIFFLCTPCLAATRAGVDAVGERVHALIDALATQQDQLSRTAEA